MDELPGVHRLDPLPPANASTHAVMDETTSRAEGLASLVVVLGSSLSLVGLVFAFITYSLFSDLRNLSGTTLMNLLAGLFMAQLLYVIGVGGVQDPDLCSALSLSLHYVRLAVLCWLTASAHHMHATFRDYRPSATKQGLSASFVRYSLFGWGAPLLCLAASASMPASGDDSLSVGATHHHSHRLRHLRLQRPHAHMMDQLLHHEALVLGTKVDHLPFHHNSTSVLGSSSTFLSEDVAAAEGECWFPDGGTWAFGLGFLAPAIALLVADAVLLVKSAILVRYTSTLMAHDKKAGEKMKANRKLQVRLFSRLSVLLGIVTALGAAARLSTTYMHQHHNLPHPSSTLTNFSAHLLPSSTVASEEVTTAIYEAKDSSPTASSHLNSNEEAQNPGSSAIWLAFDVANALQGIMVALFVTCDCGVLKLYTRSLRRRNRRSGSRRCRRNSSRGGGASLLGRGKGPGDGASHRPQWRLMSKSPSLQLLTWDPVPDTV